MKNDPRSCERIFTVLIYDLFHIHLSHSSLTVTYEHIIDQLPTSVASLLSWLEHRTGIARSWVQIPLKS